MASLGGYSPASLDRPPSTELLTEVRPVLSEATQFIQNGFGTPEADQEMSAVLENIRLATGVTSKDKFTASIVRLAKTYNEITVAAANVVIDESKPGQEEEFAQELLQSLVSDMRGFRAGVDHVLSMKPPVLVMAQSARILRSLSETVVSTLNSSVTTPEEQAALVRLLAHRAPVVEGTPHEPDITTLQALYTFTALRQDTESIEPRIVQALEGGSLDGPIADEVFSEYENDPKDSENDKRYHEEVRSIVKFNAHMMGSEVELAEAVKKLATPQSLLLLPGPYRVLLETRKNHYLQNLDRNYSTMRDLLAENNSLPVKKTLEEIGQMTEDILETLAKLKTMNRATPRAERVAAQIAGDAIRKRKRQRSSLPEQPQVPEQADVPEAPKPEHKLAYKRADGTLVAENESGFNEPFDDYLKQHPGQPKLEELLDAIKDYLKEADFSHGRPPKGVKPLQRGKKSRRAVLSTSKYQLKPSEAPGLQTYSRQGSAIRVVFEREEDTIVILAVAHKDDMNSVFRRLKIPAA